MPWNWCHPALSVWGAGGYTSPAGTGENGSCLVGPTGASTKGGCGSGTWASLTSEGIPHLKKLGVTGLWIAGSSLADAHFFGLWSTYATIDPSVLDPALGSPASFKAM